MEVTALEAGQKTLALEEPPLTPEEQQAIADAEAAFAGAVGSVVTSMAMNSMSVLTETLSEIGKEE